MTRELKSVDLLENAVQGECYSSDIQCLRNSLSPGIINLSISVRNTSNRAWDESEGDAFRIALILLDQNGKVIYRVDGWDLNQPVSIGEFLEIGIYFETPLLDNASFIMVDLVDHESCLFKDRGSTPFLLEL